MKKVLAYIGIVFILSTSGALAQVDTTTSCSVVGSGNYSACCGLAAAADNTAACKYYEQMMQIICKNITSKDTYNTCCGSNSVIRQQNEASCSSYEAAAQAAGTLGSGTGGTQGINPVNTGAQASGTIGPTPQSSSSTLASCNAIRFDSLLDILIWIKCVIGAVIIPLLFTAAFLVFLIGVIRFIRSSDNQAKRDEYKRFMFIGIIGLTVMVSVWGIVRIVTSTFGLGNTVPQLQTDCLTTDKNNPCR